MLKIGVLLLLGLLLLGTVVADWFMRGPTTAAFGPCLLLGGVAAALLFGLGIGVAKRHQTFLGFSLWQWCFLPVAVFCLGIALRVYVL
jgi:hypothetical protein